MNKNKILCLDYGKVRIGVAVSDPTNTIANPRELIKNDCKQETLAAKIAKLAEENNASQIVIGLPKKLNGTDGGASFEIRQLASILKEKFNLETSLWDERFSSVSAENILIEAGFSRKKRKDKIDSLSAVLILQNYLDFLNKDKKNNEKESFK